MSATRVLLVVLALGVSTGVVIALGTAARRGALRDRWPLLVFTVLVVFAGVQAEITSSPEAPRIEVFFGILVAALGFAALPLAAYYALGRFVHSRAVLTTVWLLSLVPFGCWLFGTFVLLFSLTWCGFYGGECA